MAADALPDASPGGVPHASPGTLPSPDAGAVARPVILVSACLLGVRCNHLGSASPSPAVLALAASHRLVPVCPEVAGGLPTPRPPAELQPDGRVLTDSGEDVTALYRRGASAAVALARSVGAVRAVLKARSPSCGCHQVYDGSFSRNLVPGSGLAAAALRAAGFEVGDEDAESRRPSATSAPAPAPSDPPPTMVGPSGA
jgi:uncharacterized protein YbbK (DUF523 family)